MALEHNVDLNADRLDPQISDTRVAAASAAFRPTINSAVNRNNQLQPPSSFLIPTSTRTDAVTSNAGLSQRLPWYGTSYSIAWNAVHTNSNSFLNSYNPLVQSGLTLNISQPLVRDLAVDASRQQLIASRINRDIAGTRLRESIVHTTANVKSMYWALVAAIANVEARTSTLALAQELARVNKAKVDVGQSPPIDLVSAQAEVAANEEQLIIAQTTVRQAEDRLRLLIFDPTDRERLERARSSRSIRRRWRTSRSMSTRPSPGRWATAPTSHGPRATSTTPRRPSSSPATRSCPTSGSTPATSPAVSAARRYCARAASRAPLSAPGRSTISGRCSTSCSPTTTPPGRSASACRTRSDRATKKRRTRAPGSSAPRPASASRAARRARFSRCAMPAGRST